MDWLKTLFGLKGKPRVTSIAPPRWTSQRGDEWWCGDASASFSCGTFTIGSFGKNAGSSYTLQLIKDARGGFPDATIDVVLDEGTKPIIETLVQNQHIGVIEIQLSPKTRVARISKIL